MSHSEGDLLIGEGPQVYFIHQGKRRWVPDPTTLGVLEPRSWAAVRQIPQAELTAIEVGRALPKMADGTLLVAADQTAYVASGSLLHLVPDAETLATIPRDRVDSLDPADLALLHDPIGAPLPSVKDASAQALAIDAYVRSLAPLPTEERRDEEGPVVRRPGITEVDGVAVEIEERRVRMVRNVTDFVEISPIADVMWAGATVTGASVGPGALAPIALNRSPGWITVTTDLTVPQVKSQSRRLDSPSLRTYVDELAELVDDLKPTDSAASASMQMEQISTLEQGMLSFGLNLKGSGWGVDAKARLDAKLESSSVFGMFSQAYYQVAFTPEGSPPRFFADDVTLDEVKAYAGPNNPPCYVATVTYGRALIFLVESLSSGLDVKAALSGSWTAAVSGAADLQAEYKKTLSRSSITAVVLGGSSAGVGDVILDPANNLLGWIKSQLTITSDRPVAPISYTVKYLAPPHNLVKVTRTTDPVKIVDANVLGGREVRGRFQVGEGPGRGPVPTGIRLNRGDEVTVTASGSIWAGWTFLGRNGPDGLDGPPKPWYPLPTGDGVRGSMLISGWDNSAWFPIGSGRRFSVPAEQEDAELWFRLNDDDQTNGNGSFDVDVTVRRRLPVINAMGS